MIPSGKLFYLLHLENASSFFKTSGDVFFSLESAQTPQKALATPHLGSSSLFKSLLGGTSREGIAIYHSRVWFPQLLFETLKGRCVVTGLRILRTQPRTSTCWLCAGMYKQGICGSVFPRVTAGEWQSRSWAQVSSPVPCSLCDLILNFQESELENPEDSSWAYVLWSKI